MKRGTDATHLSAMPLEELVQFGDRLMQRGRHNRAVLAYESALAEDPMNLAATIGKAGALISLGDLAKGEQVLSAIPEDTLAGSVEIRRYAFWQAYLASQSGDLDRAHQLIEKWLPRLDDRGRSRLLTLAARTLLQQRNEQEGRRRIQEAWGLVDRSDGPSLAWLANVAFLCHSFEVSRDAARSAIRIRASLPLASLYLFSQWYRLKPSVRILAAAVTLAAMFLASWGVYLFVALEGVLLLTAFVGWRAKIGGLVVSATGTAGGLMVAYLLLVLYRALT